MAPRHTAHRRKAGRQPSTSGKLPTKSSSPSLTLTEILNLIGLKYNNATQQLTGDTAQVPAVPTLEQLRKLLNKLNDQLEIVANHDDGLIKDINEALRQSAAVESEEEQVKEEEEEQAEGETKEEPTDVKTEEQDEDVEMELDEPAGAADPEENVPEEVKKNKDASEQEVQRKEHQAGEQVEQAEKDVEMEVDGAAEDKEKEQTDASKESSEAIKQETEDAKELSEEEQEVKTTIENEKRELMENDPSVKNPKSEFVKPQTLPAAAQALGLFCEKDGGLEEHGELYLKEKYGVSSYPQNDLKSLLPGPIPDIDFSKSKPSNQVQFTTFQSFIENFYRDFNDDDIKFLKNKFIIPESLMNDPNYDPSLTPFLIPNLGALYSTIWNEEENSGNYSPPPNTITLDSIIPKQSSNELNDDSLESEDVSCGPLVSRLLSAIIKDDNALNNGNNENNDNNDSSNDNDSSSKLTSLSAISDQQGFKVSSLNTDYSTLEERLKRELKYIGIFMNLSDRNGQNNGNNNNNSSNSNEEDDDQDIDWLNPQDDEVSAELRRLQAELESVNKRNNKRKRQLLPLLEQQLAFKEYMSILDDLDKQVDQAYLKRIKTPKNKKKKPNPANVNAAEVSPAVQQQLAAQQAHQAAANSAIRSLLEKRLRWIHKIGPLFNNDHQKMQAIPKESVFKNLDDDDDSDDDDYEAAEDLVLQQQH